MRYKWISSNSSSSSNNNSSSSSSNATEWCYQPSGAFPEHERQDSRFGERSNDSPSRLRGCSGERVKEEEIAKNQEHS